MLYSRLVNDERYSKTHVKLEYRREGALKFAWEVERSFTDVVTFEIVFEKKIAVCKAEENEKRALRDERIIKLFKEHDLFEGLWLKAWYIFFRWFSWEQRAKYYKEKPHMSHMKFIPQANRTCVCVCACTCVHAHESRTTWNYDINQTVIKNNVS